MNTTSKCIAINGVTLNVIERGRLEQPPLVLLHGFTGSAAGWGNLLDVLAHYQLHVIALDMLGHGESALPEDEQRYTIDHCQRDIIAVLQNLGIRAGEAILLGYSMGGRIALYSAFSGFFRALILESASPGLLDPDEREQRRQSDHLLAEHIEREGVAAFIAYWEQLPLFTSQQALSAERRAILHAQRLLNQASGLANSLRGVGTGTQPALHDQLPTLVLPILMITGVLDNKFCTIAQQMALALPHAQLCIVPNAGHTVHLEQPAQFVQTVGEFCRNLADTQNDLFAL
jgi:2-succinyl-6-hydroxy-2,4-cyclohexadiene-1-carboxylate synthase